MPGRRPAAVRFSTVIYSAPPQRRRLPCLSWEMERMLPGRLPTGLGHLPLKSTAYALKEMFVFCSFLSGGLLVIPNLKPNVFLLSLPAPALGAPPLAHSGARHGVRIAPTSPGSLSPRHLLTQVCGSAACEPVRGEAMSSPFVSVPLLTSCPSGGCRQRT